MAFTNVADTSRIPRSRTFIEAVARVKRACGMPDPADLVTPEKSTLIAMAAVQDAVDMVWSAARWSWRIASRLFYFENNAAVYDLPEDWQEAHGDPVQLDIDSYQTSSEEFAITRVSFTELIAKLPQSIFAVPLEEVQAGGGLAALNQVQSMATDERYAGRPKVWAIHGDKIVFFPIPNEDLAGEGWSVSAPIAFFYYMTMPKLEQESDMIPLPPELLNAAHYLALGMFKQALEYGDFQYDEARGLNMLRDAVTREQMRRGDDARFVIEED